MSVSQASRTLVKSAPELWAEISDPVALARHLEQFGEIRITRAEAERTVAWEGDRASGTVELEVSGWGTKVSLTAQLAGEVSTAAPPLLAAPEPLYPLPSPPVPAPVAPQEDAAPAVQPAAPQPATGRAAPAATTPRRGFFTRLFARRPAPSRHGLEPTAPAATAAPPKPDPAPLPVAARALPRPAPVMQPTRVRIGPIRVLELPPSVVAEAAAKLESVLDVLGTAHRRPFSRG